MSVEVTREDGVAVVTIDRPDALNALDLPTLTSLRETLSDLAGDEAVRAVVLTGAGEKAFVAGADIRYMLDRDVEGARAWGKLGHAVADLLETMPKPTIAAINGFALGGGCEIALACDIRYASQSARLGQPEISIGIVPGWGGTQRLARVAGLGFAKELVFTGRMVSADEARERGLVNAVFPPDELMEKTLELARLLAAKSPLVMAKAKELVNLSLQGSLADALSGEVDVFAELFATADRREGMTAFVEKREPRFTGH